MVCSGIVLSANDFTASLSYSLQAQTPEQTLYIGDKGYLTLHSPAHCPTKLVLTKVGGREQSSTQTFDFDLPLPDPQARLPAGVCSASDCAEPYEMFHYPNSVGMLYEAEAMMECLRDGVLECKEYSHRDSLAVMDICDQVRSQLGVKWPFEH